MSLDTVKLRSVSIPESLAEKLDVLTVERLSFDHREGVTLYSFKKGSQAGSWDSTVAFEVKREEWKLHSGKAHPQLTACDPFLEIEFSIHKFFRGQNVVGGFGDAPSMIPTALKLISEMLTGDPDAFPDSSRWMVCRIDWAENFRLGKKAVAEFFAHVHQAVFPRRDQKMSKYHDGLYFPGSTTTLKFYGKGSEFKAHDAKRLMKARLTAARLIHDEYPDQYAWARRGVQALQRLADATVRVEVEIHADKLRKDFGKLPQIHQLTDEYLKSIWEAEAFKVLREKDTEMETVRESDAVHRRLLALHSKRKANNLHSFWQSMSLDGEAFCKRKFAEKTFYRNRKDLIESGVSWLGTNLAVVETAKVLTFRPSLSHPARATRPLRESSIYRFCPVEWSATLNDLRRAA